MVDNNVYKDNPLNSSMHYGNKPLVGVLNLPDAPAAKKIYSYFEGEQLYNNLEHDIWVQSKKAKPKKKGVPNIIKLFIGVLAAGALLLGGKGIFKSLIGIFKH